MRMFASAALSLLLIACSSASTDPPPQTFPAGATPLTGEQLRRLLSDTNTYLTPVRSGDVIISHPPGELFRPNGTYSRRTGRTGLEGWYTTEGDLLCVTGDGIPKQCRKLIPQGGKTYLLVDVADGSRAVVELSQRK